MAKKGGATKTEESMVVTSRVKAALKSHGCNTASDALEGLNGWIGWLVQQATDRAKANGRKTVRKHDFLCCK